MLTADLSEIVDKETRQARQICRRPHRSHEQIVMLTMPGVHLVFMAAMYY